MVSAQGDIEVDLSGSLQFRMPGLSRPASAWMGFCVCKTAGPDFLHLVFGDVLIDFGDEQFPAEDENVLLPLSNFSVVGMRREVPFIFCYIVHAFYLFICCPQPNTKCSYFSVLLVLHRYRPSSSIQAAQEINQSTYWRSD